MRIFKINKKRLVFFMFLLIFCVIFTPLTQGFNILKNTKSDEGVWEKLHYSQYPGEEPNGLGEYYLSANCSISQEASYITKDINLEGLSIATIGFSYYYSGHGVAIVGVYSGGHGPSYWEETIFFYPSGSPQIDDFETEIFPNLYSDPDEVYLEFYYFNDYGTIFPGFSIDDLSIIEIGYFDSFEINDGSLSGYVKDPMENPIDGAHVRVYFHGTYEEDYSDETGYYYVDNIPICYCMKNCTCSKEGYKPEWILMGIAENTTYDFTLYPEDIYPVFNGSQCNSWWNSPVTVTFVYNPEEVAEIWYDYHGWHQYSEPFVVDEDGIINIDYYWIDFEGQQSPYASFNLKIDQQTPNTYINWETYKKSGKWYVQIVFIAEDPISGLSDFLDIYINDVLQETIPFVGPEYAISFEWSNFMKTWSFGFGISDNACNHIIDKVNGSDIKSYQRSQYHFFLILEKFPLLQRIFERIGRGIID